MPAEPLLAHYISWNRNKPDFVERRLGVVSRNMNVGACHSDSMPGPTPSDGTVKSESPIRVV